MFQGYGCNLRRFDLLIENKDDLAKLMVLEQGKPFAEAANEVIYFPDIWKLATLAMCLLNSTDTFDES